METCSSASGRTRQPWVGKLQVLGRCLSQTHTLQHAWGTTARVEHYNRSLAPQHAWSTTTGVEHHSTCGAPQHAWSTTARVEHNSTRGAPQHAWSPSARVEHHSTPGATQHAWSITARDSFVIHPLLLGKVRQSNITRILGLFYFLLFLNV